jgi:hypothetical protein
MVTAFQKVNAKHAIYADAQKGFVKNTNGYNENNSRLNELFQDAKRKKTDLIVTAIDFTNASGSIPHG